MTGSQHRPERVEVRVPASTSNLGPGFDSIGLAVQLYNDFLKEPLGEISHHLLHTTYEPRQRI